MSAVSLSPLQRAWARFQRNRMGYWSLWIFVAMLLGTMQMGFWIGIAKAFAAFTL